MTGRRAPSPSTVVLLAHETLADPLDIPPSPAFKAYIDKALWRYVPHPQGWPWPVRVAAWICNVTLPTRLMGDDA